MSEFKIMQDIQVFASKLGCRLFRNNVGLGWVGKSVRIDRRMTVQVDAGDVIVKHARPLHAGLCLGSSDLIGFTPIVVTESMIGQTFAVFTAAEIKDSNGRATKEQAAFLAMIHDMGGIAVLAKSGDNLTAAVNKKRGV